MERSKNNTENWTSKYRSLPSNSGNASENSEIPFPQEQEAKARQVWRDGGQGISCWGSCDSRNLCPHCTVQSTWQLPAELKYTCPTITSGLGPTETRGQVFTTVWIMKVERGVIQECLRRGMLKELQFIYTTEYNMSVWVNTPDVQGKPQINLKNVMLRAKQHIAWRLNIVWYHYVKFKNVQKQYCINGGAWTHTLWQKHKNIPGNDLKPTWDEGWSKGRGGTSGCSCHTLYI